nr:hypothetical protein [Tanacetum cinerariifolium]
MVASIRSNPRQHLINLALNGLIHVVVPGAKKPWGILLLKLGGEEVFVEEQEIVKDVNANVVEEVVNAAKDKNRRKHFIAKRAKEKRNKPPTQAQKRKIMCTYLKNMKGYTLKQLKSFEFDKIQEMFDRAFKRVNTFEPIRSELVERKEKRAGEELIQESTKKQKVEDDKETTDLRQLMEIISNEEVAIDAIPLAVKSLKILDWKIYKEGKKSFSQIIRADGKTKMYMVFSKMLESFDREDLEDLYKLVITKFNSTRPEEDLDLLLWGDLKIMFEPHVEDAIWKKQQGYKGMIVGIKSLLDAFGITAAHVYVNTAQPELVLLVDFNKKYAKCLLLLVEVKTASTMLMLLI